MNDRRPMHAWQAAALAIALSAPAARPASAQWAPLDRLPGSEQVKGIKAPASGAGRVSEVRWDMEARKAWFQYAGGWKWVPLDGGEVQEGGEPPAAAPAEKAYRAPRGGRAKQATEVPSPDGAWTAVFKDCNVVLRPKEGEPVAVTTEGAGKRWFGSADWVYGEELDQNSAMWWSPDSKHIAYYDFDETPVKDYYLLAGLSGLRTRPVSGGYPKPGDPNPVAKLEVYDLASGKRTPVDVGPSADQYVYGVRWSPKGDALLWFRAPRRQDMVELMVTDPATGASRALITERQESWQENSPTIRFLEDGSRFLWESESNGHSNWELWDLAKGRLARLTDDPWVAESIVEVDERAGWVYYMARSSPTAICSQLHRVRLDGSARERLTPGDLHHSAVHVAPDHSCFVSTCEFVDVAPSAALRSMDGRDLATLTKPVPDSLAKQGLEKPEFIRCLAADGKTELYGILWKPPGFDPSKRYPLVVDAYGGPLIATVSPRFAGVDPDVGRGVLVARVDNRGTPGRGKAFEAATYLKLGGPDVDDQAAFVAELAKRPYVDGDRVAICGHSYGGYMALLAALRHPETFHVAVAGAPPTDWRQYDTIYTERVMRTPQENEAGYDAGSAIKLAGTLKGRVLLLHGMMDDNVHVANTFALADAWQSGNIPFEMQIFPKADHGIGSPAYESAKWSFILRNFGMWSEPPVGGR
jgi:dipeptidyl-peptidase-4